MSLVIHGSAHSTCTKRVATICKELNVPYTLIPVDLMSGAQKTPEFIKHHPFAVIPYVEIDGIEIIESRAIARYIAFKYGADSGLVPKAGDWAAIAKFESMASVETANFDPYASKLVYERVFKPMMNATPDEKQAEYLAAQLDIKLAGYERILAGSKYLTGDSVSIIDLFHLPYAGLLAAAKYDLVKDRPNVARWWNDISSRESWTSLAGGA